MADYHIKSIILDVDGVLRDYSALFCSSLSAAFKKYDITCKFRQKDIWHLRGFETYGPRKEIIRTLISCSLAGFDLNNIINGSDPEKTLKNLLSSLPPVPDELITKISDEYEVYFRSHIGEIKIIPGSKHALDKLSGYGYTLGLLTTSDKESLYKDLEKIGINYFKIIISKEDVKHLKPNPEGLHKISRALAIKTKDILYVGDTQVDVLTAKNAGALSGVVLTGMGIRNAFVDLKPDFIANDLSELTDRLNFNWI